MGDPRRRLGRARRLTRRYLDPGRPWGPELDAELRALTRIDPACAAVYRGAVVAHRLMVGGDPGVPSGFERQRMMTAALPAARRDAPRRAPRALIAAAAAALVSAALIAIALRPIAQAPPASEWIHARGLPAALFPEPLTGLGLSGVSDAGDEYEVIASRRALLGDWIRLTYTNERPQLRWLFVVGLQPERPADERLVWLAPIPEERLSLPIGIGRYRPLDFEIRLAARHAEGPWRVIALFTERPLSVDEVRAALDLEAPALLSSELPDTLSARLRLSDDAVIEVLDTRISSANPREEERP